MGKLYGLYIKLSRDGKIKRTLSAVKGKGKLKDTTIAEELNSFSGKSISAKALKQMMNKWRYTLEENNVFFTSGRSNGKRYIKTWYLPSADESDGSDV